MFADLREDCSEFCIPCILTYIYFRSHHLLQISPLNTNFNEHVALVVYDQHVFVSNLVKEIIPYFKCSHRKKNSCYPRLGIMFYLTDLIYDQFTSTMFEFQNIFLWRRASHCLLEALTACTHLLGWLTHSLAWHFLYCLVERRYRRGKSQPTMGSSLICDWCLTGSARDDGRVSAFNSLVGGAFHHFLF